MAYSELVQRASLGEVTAVVQEGNDLSVTLRGESAEHSVTVSEQLDVWQQLCAAGRPDEGAACGIRYEFREPSTTGSLATLVVTALLPVVLIGGFIYFTMRRAQATTRP